jgi:hypothetical protein
MQPAIDQFHANFIYVRGLIGLANAVDAQTAGALDVSEVYRSSGSLHDALTHITQPGWLESEVRELHVLQSFQKADRIADAIRLFSTVELWPTVAGHLGSTPQHVKAQVDLLADRRNKIVHEFDNEPTGLGDRWPMSAQIAEGAADFVEGVVEAVDLVV